MVTIVVCLYKSQFYQYDELGRLTAVVKTVIIEGEKKEIKTKYRYDEIDTVEQQYLLLEVVRFLIGLVIPILVAYFVWVKLIQTYILL